MLVMTTIFTSKIEELPPTSDMKMIDIWLISCLVIPFLEVILRTIIESLNCSCEICEGKGANNCKPGGEAKMREERNEILQVFVGTGAMVAPQQVILIQLPLLCNPNTSKTGFDWGTKEREFHSSNAAGQGARRMHWGGRLSWKLPKGNLEASLWNNRWDFFLFLDRSNLFKLCNHPKNIEQKLFRNLGAAYHRHCSRYGLYSPCRHLLHFRRIDISNKPNLDPSFLCYKMIKNENAKICQNNKRNSAALMKRVYNLAASEPLWQPWMIKRFVMKINAEFVLFTWSCINKDSV